MLPGIGETENLLKKLNITLTEKDIILKVWIFYFDFFKSFLEISKSSIPGYFFTLSAGFQIDSYKMALLANQSAIQKYQFENSAELKV